MLTIAQVERETGLSKDVLRVWERRYGFPAPKRAESGERIFTPDEVERLRLVKRLIDQGFRPGKLLGMTVSGLIGLAQADQMPAMGEGASLAPVIRAILEDDSAVLRQTLSQGLARQGLQRFVQDAVPELSEAVGQLWASGRLGVHQEHLYSEELSRLLRTAIGNLPPSLSRPRVLLTTLSGEEHGLGLLLVEGTLVPEGVFCLSLGVQTPIDEIVQAVVAHHIDVLVLSFSVAFPARQAMASLEVLRSRLPQAVEIWAGGGMTRSLRKKPLQGVHWTSELPDCLRQLEDWRSRHLGS